ncbi:methyltransferase domain-containing protein [Rhizobium sp. CCGE531]|nr:methyltransferase domain-containing protein [Rhizobium sp. CCGE531]AYG72262.1 methyltransferase domain-containing protein [Rhizobium sp. CCGE532]
MIMNLREPKPWTAADGLFNHAVNYACGVKPINGWVNLDIFDASFTSSLEKGASLEHLDSVFNVDLLGQHPFSDNSFNLAYCEDFVEHLDQREAILFFTEVLRTLRPGGVFRLATPSLDGVMNQHFRYPTREIAYHQADNAFTRWGHKHFFTHESLKVMITSIGFTDYRECRFGVSDSVGLRGRETRHAQIGLNLYAEMRKPL